jgi:DNA-binding transcriptional MerR regulator
MATDPESFRSGMAARLAGLPVATLRVWERRYGLGGLQSGVAGHRRYTRDDIARLVLLKRLVDAGHPIGSLAPLSAEALRRMEAVSASAAQPRGAPVRVALCGAALCERADEFRALESLEVVGISPGLEEAATALRGLRADVLALSVPTLNDEAVERVDGLCALLGARRAVVAYRFGTQGRVDTLRGRGHATVRGALEAARLDALARAVPGSEPPGAWPAPRLYPVRFDERTLARLAQASTTIACECPRHLVELLLDLGAFERYSAECAHRNPRDAELHRELQRVSSTARAMLEEALARIAAEDGLAVDGK